MAGTKDISISIGDAEISFDSVSVAPDRISVSVKKESKYLFEFNGLLSDKFKAIKKSNPDGSKTLEIILERGLGSTLETIPLIRINHY